MKLITASALVLAAAVAITPLAMAEDGAALYGAKCKMCHGDAGQGKMGPKLVGTTKDVAKVITTGGLTKAPHTKAVAGVTPEQATAIAAFVKGLK
jgi:mono/diheme cytochrome c family protein